MFSREFKRITGLASMSHRFTVGIARRKQPRTKNPHIEYNEHLRTFFT